MIRAQRLYCRNAGFGNLETYFVEIIKVERGNIHYKYAEVLNPPYLVGLDNRFRDTEEVFLELFSSFSPEQLLL